MDDEDGKKSAWIYGEKEDTKKKTEKSAGRKVWLLEKRLAKGKGSKIAKRCLKELRKRRKREVTRSRWEEEKRRFSEERELKLVKVERARNKGENWFNKIKKRDKVKQKKKKMGQKIRKSKYNKWYECIKEERVSWDI